MPRVRSTSPRRARSRREPLAQLAAIDLELGLAGSARADSGARAAAAHARQMRPLAREPRLQVGELRDLDLQLAFQGPRALRENVQNELAAIDHAQLHLVLEVARLRGRQRVVEDRERGASGRGDLAHLGGLTLADKSARVGSLELLADGRSDRCTRAFRQRAQLSQ